jgi:uncharacterized membrane protein YgdD (TMEM256/DUF423 family)
MNTQKKWLIISAVMGFLGVALGAFGAHGLRNLVTPEILETYKTGVQYHLIHAAALFTLALYGSTAFLKAAKFFLIGIILFSFSLYFYSVTGVKWLAIITPFGGVSFLTGWAAIAYFAIKNGSDAKQP